MSSIGIRAFFSRMRSSSSIVGTPHSSIYRCIIAYSAADCTSVRLIFAAELQGPSHKRSSKARLRAVHVRLLRRCHKKSARSCTWHKRALFKFRVYPSAGVSPVSSRFSASGATSALPRGRARARCSRHPTCHFLILHVIHNGIRRGGDRRDLNLHIAVAQGGQVPLAVLAAGKDIVHILRGLSGRGQGQLTGGVV